MFTVLNLVGEGDEISEAAELFSGIAADVTMFYLLNLPYLLMQFAPYITLLAALATVISLRRLQEWTPMLVAGRSTIRAFMPMFLSALLIGVLLLLLREQLFPLIQNPRAQLQSKIFDQKTWQLQEIWVRGPHNEHMSVGEFIPRGMESETQPSEVTALELVTLGSEGEDLFYRADKATWDGDKWVLENGRLITSGDRASEQSASEIALDGLRPIDIERAWRGQNSPIELTIADASHLLARDPGHSQAATLIWSMRISPIVHLILLLLGLPYVLSFERKSSLEGVAFGLLLCALFFVVDFLFQDFGHRHILSPWLAGVAPVLLFAGFSLRAQERFAT
jgi:lipopolysaccharide export LptBFGC system permease protein LptF